MLSAPVATAAEKKYWCYYPHRLIYSVSPVCGIFFVLTMFLDMTHSFLTRIGIEISHYLYFKLFLTAETIFALLDIISLYLAFGRISTER